MKVLESNPALRVAVLYSLFSGGWILVSDRLLELFVDNSSTLSWLQTYKGGAFVAVSALFLFLILSREIIERDRVAQQKRQGDEMIQRQLQRLAALRAIDLAITATLDQRIIFDVLLDQVVGQLGVDAAAVLLYDPVTQRLEYASGRGFFTSGIQDASLALGRGVAGKVAQDRRMISIPDLSQSGSFFTRQFLIADEAIIAYHGVPLVCKGEVKGVLEVFHRHPFSFDEDGMNFLEALAGQAAIAIDNAMLYEGVQRSSDELAQAYDDTLAGWSKTLGLRDQETQDHSQRVTEMTLRIAKEMGITDDELIHIRRGTLLHDIGKLAIPDSILLKPGPLNDDEWEIMRRHPVYAYELISPIQFLHPALDIPYCHHERWNGSGYPRGLSGEQIPLAARIFAVVDVWDALRSNRTYRKAWPLEEVEEHIRQNSGKYFDPRVVDLFLKISRQVEDHLGSTG